MDRLIEKTLDKVQKYKAKGNYAKARALLDELPLTSRGALDVVRELVHVSLRLDPWQDVLKVLRQAVIAHEFLDLLGGDNREPFVTLVREHAAFSSALLDMLGQLRHLRAVAGWLELSDPADQRYLIDNWRRHGEEAVDVGKEALLKVCAGVGLMLTNDEPGAFALWGQALRADPGQLKKVMAFCQGLSGNQKDLQSRLRIIKLVAAADKKNESLTLLKALGAESDANAMKVLTEIRDLMPGEEKTKEVLGVRFNLALKLGDPEIIQAVVRDMQELGEDDLFPFKKQALHQLTDPVLRQTVLLQFVRLYINQENWENAAPLLQQLYEENPGKEVVALMEVVLDRFPIISSLRFVLGRHMLQAGNVVSAMQHLITIAQVPEFEHRIKHLLEERLMVQYDSEPARLLVRLHPLFSMEAGLVACLMAVKDPRGFLAALPEWGDPHLREQRNPFWALAFTRANLVLKRFDQACAFLMQFLRRFPDLSPEVVYTAEVLCSHHVVDYSDLIRLIDSVSDRLEPKRAWAALRKRFIVVTKQAKSALMRASAEHPAVAEPEPAAPAAVPVPPAPSPEPRPAPEPAAARPAAGTQNTGVPPEFHQFRGHLETGNHRAAAAVAEKTVAAYPQSILFVLNQLDRLCREQPREILWPVTMLRILNASAAFEKATELGRRVLANHHFQADMPQIYQLLARSYEGLGNHNEALRFYCLSSRQPRFYEQNRARLVEMVLPHHHTFIDEVVHLVHNHEDAEVWEELMKLWYKTRPEDLDRIIEAQEAFSAQLGNPRAQLDLAFWYLQAGRLQEIDDTLAKIDLQDPEIMEYLTHIAHLAHLKYPDDPKPKFFLGKYYLVQHDVTKAVDTFRNLARQIPDAAETIYHFLRAYLKKSAGETDVVTLYGLLIRFALDYGSAVTAVRLLEELGRRDREGAAGLVQGVYRVILRKDERLEAMYELMHLLYNWEDYGRLLDVAEEGGFGDHMAAERLEWLHVAGNEPAHHDRAMLCIAGVYFDTFDFSRCREALRRIEHGTYRRRALPLYERLCERFPEQMDVWREAGWAAFPQEPDKARLYFRKLFTCPSFENRLEGYALLRELGEDPPLDDLTALVDDADLVFDRLRRLHGLVRDSELTYLQSTGAPLTESALNWLLIQGNFDRFREDLGAAVDLSEVERVILEARALAAQGCPAPAAWHLVGHDVPLELLESMLCAAGMVERAVLAKKPGTRLPIFLRDAFLNSRGRPAMIAAGVDHLRNVRRAHGRSAEKNDEVPA